MQSPIIHCAGLTKTFKDFWRRPNVWAVRDLDLEIHPGEVFGLLGPNGSGKSTTIKVLLGLLYPTRGRVAVFGMPPTDVGIKSRIGYLPEESYVYPFLNARETLDFYGRLFRLPRAERRRRTERLLEMVGLAREAGRRLGEYSKGMARRIGLATALINDPDLLILDEPTSGLDPIGTRLIKDLIVDLGRRGKTIMLSSHLLGDVEDVCDRLMILYGGMQRALGRTHDLLSRAELTQITAPKLEQETIEEIRKLIRKHSHGAEVEVSSPSDKLESFFLRIVRQAQADKVETSGVVHRTGDLPAFLRSGAEDQNVVEALVEAGRQKTMEPEPEPESSPEPAEAQPDREVIQNLVEGATHPEPEPTSAEPEIPAALEEPRVDRSVIDSLVNGSEKDRPATTPRKPNDG
jgi:ABC-2 type transport system ATP-binding protein